jgi:hypothetical protein
MMRIVFAFLFVSTLSQAGGFPYEAAFNEYGFATMQTATMGPGDYALVWFITPAEGKYLIQVSNGSDSPAQLHYAVITDANGAPIMRQTAWYPSFYVNVGKDLPTYTLHFMYVYNPGCANVCNVTVLTQPTS